MLSLQIISVSSIKISPCARWEKHGTTIAGTGRSGSSLSELNEPLGIAIYNRTNDLYIADHRNARIQMLSLNNLSNETTTVVSQIYFPLDVIVDDENDQSIVYATLSVDSHVERWNPDDIVGTRISDDCNDCVSLAIDREKNIYITDTTQNCILKWSRATNRTRLVAGKAGQSGTKNDKLQTPQGIYITRDGTTVFISDSGNSRIQKWIIGEDSAVTVAGSENGTSSNETSHLQYPIGIRVDEDTQVLYIADTYNNRIVRWLLGDDHGEIIVGSTGTHKNAHSTSNSFISLNFRDRQQAGSVE